MNWLKGRKTYLVAAAGVIVTAANLLGFINTEEWATLMGLLGFTGLATVRAGISKK